MRRALPVHLLVLVLSAAVGLLLVGPAVSGYFILDDFAWLECALESTTNLGHLFTLHISNFFRPVAHAVWTATYALFGPSPLHFHLVLLLLHAAATSLLSLLLARVFADRYLALTAALCFLLNPAYSEAVIWVSGLTEPVAAIAVLATLLAFHRFLTRPRGRALSLVLLLGAFLAAHGAKESAVVLLPLMLMLHLGLASSGRLPPGRRWAVYLPLAVLEAGYLVLQYRLQQHSYLVIEDRYALGLHGLVSVGTSLQHLFNLTWPAFGAAALGAVLTRDRGVPRLARTRWKALALLIGTVVVPMVPYAMFRGGVLASRYFYLPAMSAALLSALALRYLFRSGRTGQRVLGLLALAGLALQAVQASRGAVTRYLRAAGQTRQFVDAVRRIPIDGRPALILDAVLRGQHLRGAMRIYHPGGTIRDVTRRELRRGAWGTVWRYTDGKLVKIGPGTRKDLEGRGAKRSAEP